MAKLPKPVPIIPNPMWLKQYHHIGSDYTHLLPNSLGLEKSAMHTDLMICLHHVMQYTGSQETMEAYRTEANRFLNWLWQIHGKTLREVRRNDVVEYLDFSMFPPKAWVSENTPPQFFYGDEGELTVNPEWLPFAAEARARSSVDAIFSRLSSLFEQEALLNLIGHNPIQAIRQKNKYRQRIQGFSSPKVITKKQVGYCFEVLEDLCHQAKEPRQILIAERALFAFSLALGNYLRISEFIDCERHTPVHGHFTRDQDGNWWLYVVGKGNKARDVPISDDVLEALMRWRDVLELAPLPEASDTTPLFPKLSNDVWNAEANAPRVQIGVTDTLVVWKTFRSIFRTAYMRMLDEDKECDALELLQASAHWLRHTGITNDLEERPLEHIRDDAGHSSSQTTMRYVNATNRDRAASKSRTRLREKS